MDESSGGTWAWITANYEGLLVAGGGLGLLLAYWRSVVAHRQARAALKQAEASLRQSLVLEKQSEISAEHLMNEQFRIGTELLGSKVLTVRLGGITILADIMKLHPRAVHVRVMRLFVTFLTYPPRDADTNRIDFGSPDILEIVAVIEGTGKEERDLEKSVHFDLERSLRSTHFPLKKGGKIRMRIPEPPEEPPDDVY